MGLTRRTLTHVAPQIHTNKFSLCVTEGEYARLCVCVCVCVCVRVHRDITRHGSTIATLGNASKTAAKVALTDLLVNRIRTRHNLPEFDLAQWLAELPRSQAASLPAHKIVKEGFGSKDELFAESTRRTSRKSCQQTLTRSCSATIKPRRPHSSVSKGTLHASTLFTLDTTGARVSTTTQDPAELGRIYTHLWWSAEKK
jgi:hypothetical protein